MKLSYEDNDQMTVMTIKGELEAGETDRFRKAALERMEARIRDFVLDLEHLDTVDSRGLETLLWLQDQCAEHLGQVRLAGCRDDLKQILEMTRLATRFDCHADTETAIQSLH